MAINQCDGCKAGIPVDKDGIHHMGTGLQNMVVCTKDNYIEEEIDEVDNHEDYLFTEDKKSPADDLPF